MPGASHRFHRTPQAKKYQKPKTKVLIDFLGQVGWEGGAKNPEKFVDANYMDGAVTGMPILDNASAYLECEVTQIVDTGSGHSVIIAKVIGGDARTEGDATNTLSLQDIGWGYSG